jgi:hypothetical protein
VQGEYAPDSLCILLTALLTALAASARSPHATSATQSWTRNSFGSIRDPSQPTSAPEFLSEQGNLHAAIANSLLTTGARSLRRGNPEGAQQVLDEIVDARHDGLKRKIQARADQL